MQAEKLKGHLDLLLLSVLSRGPGHGYEIITRLKVHSDGAFELPDGRRVTCEAHVTINLIVSQISAGDFGAFFEDRFKDVVRKLVDLANAGGGPDNISCVVADVVQL